MFDECATNTAWLLNTHELYDFHMFEQTGEHMSYDHMNTPPFHINGFTGIHAVCMRCMQAKREHGGPFISQGACSASNLDGPCAVVLIQACTQ